MLYKVKEESMVCHRFADTGLVLGVKSAAVVATVCQLCAQESGRLVGGGQFRTRKLCPCPKSALISMGRDKEARSGLLLLRIKQLQLTFIVH